MEHKATNMLSVETIRILYMAHYKVSIKAHKTIRNNKQTLNLVKIREIALYSFV